MFFNRRKFSARTKKVVLVPLFFLLPIFSFFASEFPERLSDQAKISILSVNYNDISHSLFSKSCLRFFDAETNFDQIIDFACFENFEDEFFLLKFFLHGKKAGIRTAPFLDYFLAQQKQTNVSLTESLLELSPAEVAYIFQFVSTMNRALPEYSYDFDILTNNSETHISHILHDSARMVGEESTTERYSFSEITQHNLSYKQMNDSFVLLSEKEILEFHEVDFAKLFHKERMSLIIALVVFASLVFLLTVYQVLAYFFENWYLMTVFKTAQIFDFLMLFFSGLAGFVILYQDIFSNQSMFRNNFQFLFLVPLHLIAAFTIFRPIQNRTLQIYYWSITSFLSVLYIFSCSIIERKLPLVCFLLALPLFFRTAYFYFAVKDIKKERTFKPYALLIRFLDSASS